MSLLPEPGRPGTPFTVCWPCTCVLRREEGVPGDLDARPTEPGPHGSYSYCLQNCGRDLNKHCGQVTPQFRCKCRVAGCKLLSNPYPQPDPRGEHHSRRLGDPHRDGSAALAWDNRGRGKYTRNSLLSALFWHWRCSHFGDASRSAPRLTWSFVLLALLVVQMLLPCCPIL